MTYTSGLFISLTFKKLKSFCPLENENARVFLPFPLVLLEIRRLPFHPVVKKVAILVIINKDLKI